MRQNGLECGRGRYAVAVAKKRGPGRPPHADRPKMFSTNIPTSLYERLDRLSKKTTVVPAMLIEVGEA
jgi:hypothetical protein